MGVVEESRVRKSEGGGVTKDWMLPNNDKAFDWSGHMTASSDQLWLVLPLKMIGINDQSRPLPSSVTSNCSPYALFCNTAGGHFTQRLSDDNPSFFTF